MLAAIRQVWGRVFLLRVIRFHGGVKILEVRG